LQTEIYFMVTVKSMVLDKIFLKLQKINYIKKSIRFSNWLGPRLAFVQVSVTGIDQQRRNTEHASSLVRKSAT